MNNIEKKILHGLFYHRQMVGEEIPYSATELNWLANASFPDGRNWQGSDGKLHSLKSKNDDYLAALGASSADAQRPIRYLEAAGYIKCSIRTGMFRIAVTAEGANLSRQLDTWYGRLNLRYKENKDGLLWFIATILVSLITSLIVNYIK